MRPSLLLVLAALLAIPVLRAASQEPPSETDATPAAPPPDMAAFTRGAKAWGENCARCHNMRDPKELSDQQWKVTTTHMRLRAGLDGQQVRDITVFLQGSN